MMRRWFLIAAVLLWPLASSGFAFEPDSASGYVLLRDLAVLPGTVEEEPGRVIVRHQGGEVRLSREKVACWAKTLDGLYQYQLDRRRVFTVETHLDAARWCLRHGLCERAAAELVAARRLRPDAAEVQRVEAELRLILEQRVAEQKAAQQRAADERAADERAAEQTAAVGVPGGNSMAGHSSGGAQLASSGDGAAEAAELLEGLGAEQLREFNLRIQPLLANRCSATACHGGGATTAWMIADERLPGRRPSAAMTRQNLAAVLPWINREHPSASPLLVRALQPHGGGEAPPLGTHDQEAIENLRRWIESLPRQTTSAEGDAAPLVRRGEPAAPPATPAGTTVGMMGAQPSEPVRLPDVADPFDPQLFNRRFHRETR